MWPTCKEQDSLQASRCSSKVRKYPGNTVFSSWSEEYVLYPTYLSLRTSRLRISGIPPGVNFWWISQIIRPLPCCFKQLHFFVWNEGRTGESLHFLFLLATSLRYLWCMGSLTAELVSEILTWAISYYLSASGSVGRSLLNVASVSFYKLLCFGNKKGSSKSFLFDMSGSSR